MASASSPTKTAAKFLSHAQPEFNVKAAIIPETLNQTSGRGGTGWRKIVIIPFVPGKSTTALLQKDSRLERCLQVRPAGKAQPEAVLKTKLRALPTR